VSDWAMSFVSSSNLFIASVHSNFVLSFRLFSVVAVLRLSANKGEKSTAYAISTTALGALPKTLAAGPTPLASALRRRSLVGQSETSQRHARETDAEFLQCPAPRDGLGQALGRYIEFIAHEFPFVVVDVSVLLPLATGRGSKQLRGI
jgi:hypothetical protein